VIELVHRITFRKFLAFYPIVEPGVRNSTGSQKILRSPEAWPTSTPFLPQTSPFREFHRSLGSVQWLASSMARTCSSFASSNFVRIDRMKSASMPLALAVLLGLAHESGAMEVDSGFRHTAYFAHNYTVTIGKSSFGIVDAYETTATPGIGKYVFTSLCFGSHGCEVPFTATQGLIGFGVILGTLIALPIVFTVRWKKKHAVP
jgi:hypothetical protein